MSIKSPPESHDQKLLHGMMAENREINLDQDAEGCSSSVHSYLIIGYIYKAVFEELQSLSHDISVLSGSSQDILHFTGRYVFVRFITKHHRTVLKEVIHLEVDVQDSYIAFMSLFEKFFEIINSASSEKEKVSLILREETQQHTKVVLRNLGWYLLYERDQVLKWIATHFNCMEQASLMWHYLYRIPVVLMKKFLPWLMSCLSATEKNHMLKCMQKIVPNEKPLKAVIEKWLEEYHIGKEFQKYTLRVGNQVSGDLEKSWYIDITTALTKKINSDSSRVTKFTHIMYQRLLVPECEVFKEDRQSLLRSLLHRVMYWRKAIMNELTEIVSEAQELRESRNLSTVPSFIDRLLFLGELCVFHSAIKDNILFQDIDGKARKLQSINGGDTSKETSENSGHMEVFCQFCIQIDMLIAYIKQALEKPEAFPLSHEQFSINEERDLFYQSLCMMPLSLLERVMPWLFDRLSDEEMLPNMHLGAPPGDACLVKLFTMWACKRCSKDSLRSTNNFFSLNGQMVGIRKPEMQIIANTSSGIDLCASHDTFGDIDAYERKPKRAHHIQKEIESFGHGKSVLNISMDIPEYEIGQSSVASVARSEELILYSQFSSNVPGIDYGISPQQGKKVMFTLTNIIYLSHKAIRIDLDYLACESANLGMFDFNFVQQLQIKFDVLKNLFQLLRKAKDDIVFCALASKGFLHNVACSCITDHDNDVKIFKGISDALSELIRLHVDMVRNISDLHSDANKLLLQITRKKYHQLSVKSLSMFKQLRDAVQQHLLCEEVGLWPLFDNVFSLEEHDEILRHVLGTTGAEMLQKFLIWVTACLTQEEKHLMFHVLQHTARNTMFKDWLSAWWKGFPDSEQGSNSLSFLSDGAQLPLPGTRESLQFLANYIYNGSENIPSGSLATKISNCQVSSVVNWNSNGTSVHKRKLMHYSLSVTALLDTQKQEQERHWKLKHMVQELLKMNEEQLELAVRKIVSDESLDPQTKTYLMQALMSRNFATLHLQSPENEGCHLLKNDDTGKCPSYRDEQMSIFGCEHYKRNCKVVAGCCGKLYTCRQCHDKVSDHEMDRRATKHMMCMQCLCIQPVAANCAKPSCGGLSMALHFCGICNLFEDERKVYHCPFCNICRVGRGLGKDYFHCMKCNGCVSKTLMGNHKCRDKDFESNCPICQEFLFTSVKVVKNLPCGHAMHNSCFRAYAGHDYKCPVCSKSMGDMTVYFGLLDAKLAGERLSAEYEGRTQEIYCNDCEKKGKASFHWFYHKCICGSYNTRVIG